jgi:F-type H+-transporting ATPase subunit c
MKQGDEMRNYLSNIAFIALAVLVSADAAFAEEAYKYGEYGALGVALVMGIAVLGGTLGQSKAISSGLDAIGRNPSARGDIFVPMLIGLAFVESLVILAFVIALSLT